MNHTQFTSTIRKFICSLSLAIFSTTFSVNAQVFPPGFSQVAIGNIYYPTSMTVAPDGRIFACEKAGKIKIVKNGIVLPKPFLVISVNQLNERGVSSVCLDPNFALNNYVYVYYTTSTLPVHNRLSRFTASGDTAVPGSEFDILDIEPAIQSIHNAGGMEFGPDGKLYVGIGDDGSDTVNYVNPNAQNMSIYKGKVLRINADGSVPSGNPFSGSAVADRIWNYGFRNPWIIAVQSGTGKIYTNDVGQEAYEEIDDVTTGGKNYGWPFAEGYSTNPAYTNPEYAYAHGPHDSIGCAITGGTFFNPVSSNYPATYTGKYFFLDYCNKQINYIDPTVSPGQKFNFASSVGGANVSIKVGKDGNFYYLSIANNMLYKIIYSPTVATGPAITKQPSNVTVSLGQMAIFTVTATGSAPLNYQWMKNGTTIPLANSSSFTINSVATTDTGQYSVTITNGSGSVTSNKATLKISPCPFPVITPSGPTNMCSGSVVLNADTGAGKLYQWKMNGTAITGATKASYTASATGAYQIKVSSGSCIEWSAPLQVTIQSGLRATITPGGPTTFGAGGSVLLYANTCTGYSYQWKVNGVNIPGAINSTYLASTSGNYQVKVTLGTSNAWSSLVPVQVTGSNQPQVTITSPSNNSIFSNPVNIDISTSVTPAGSGIRKVDFYQDTTKIGTDLTAPYFYTWMNVTTGNYMLKAVVTDSVGKTGSSGIIHISVGSCETPVIIPTGSTTRCSGSVTLTTNSAPGIAYQWELNGTNINGATSPEYTAVASGSYQVKTILGSCISWSAPTQVTIQNNLSASITPNGPTSICPGGSVLLYANTCPNYAYQWIKDGNVLSGAVDSSYIATLAGSYQLRITQGASKVWSSLLSVQSISCNNPQNTNSDSLKSLMNSVQSPNAEKLFQMKVFPNPSNGHFTIMFNMATTKEEKVLLRIINSAGRTVYTQELLVDNDNVQKMIDLDQSLPLGIYNLQAILGSRQENTQVMLTR